MGLKSTFVAGMMVVICMVLYHRAISAEGELLDWRQQASGLKAELRGAKHTAASALKQHQHDLSRLKSVAAESKAGASTHQDDSKRLATELADAKVHAAELEGEVASLTAAEKAATTNDASEARRTNAALEKQLKLQGGDLVDSKAKQDASQAALKAALAASKVHEALEVGLEAKLAAAEKKAAAASAASVEPKAAAKADASASSLGDDMYGHMPDLDKKPTKRPEYSAHECNGQIFMQQEWAGRSCYYRNICRESNTQNWFYYRDPEIEPDSLLKLKNLDGNIGVGYFRPNGMSGKYPNGRGHIPNEMEVSLIPFNMMDGLDPASVPDYGGQGYRWQPEVRDGPIPKDAVFDDTASVFVLYMAYVSHNIGHLMMDEFFPWFLLLRSYNLLTDQMKAISVMPDRSEGSTHKSFLAPGAVPFENRETCLGYSKYVATHDKPPQACIDGYKAYTAGTENPEFLSMSMRMREEEKARLDQVFVEHDCGSRNTAKFSLLGDWTYKQGMIGLCNGIGKKFTKAMTSKETQNDHSTFSKPDESLPKIQCYSRLAAGIGFLAEHCLDGTGHGQEAGFKTPEWSPGRKQGGPDEMICNSGRDTMFWEFRNWMVRNLQLSHWPEPCEADGEVGVLFDIRSRKGRTAANHDMKLDEPARQHWDKAMESIKESFGIPINGVTLSELPLREQVKYYQKSIAAVQMAGGGATTGMFLPRGGTLVLMADNSAKNDYVMWSHMTHIHVDWFELANWKTHFDIPQLDQLIGAAISRYHQFNDCYDSYTDEAPPHLQKMLDTLHSKDFVADHSQDFKTEKRPDPY